MSRTRSRSLLVRRPRRASAASSSGAGSSRPRRSASVVDPLKLELPVFGTLFHKVALARFARNLGTLIRSGVPILQALDIVGDTVGNMVIAKRSRDVQGACRDGESLAQPLGQAPGVPADGRPDDRGR